MAYNYFRSLILCILGYSLGMAYVSATFFQPFGIFGWLTAALALWFCILLLDVANEFKKEAMRAIIAKENTVRAVIHNASQVHANATRYYFLNTHLTDQLRQTAEILTTEDGMLDREALANSIYDVLEDVKLDTTRH